MTAVLKEWGEQPPRSLFPGRARDRARAGRGGACRRSCCSWPKPRASFRFCAWCWRKWSSAWPCADPSGASPRRWTRRRASCSCLALLLERLERETVHFARAGRACAARSKRRASPRRGKSSGSTRLVHTSTPPAISFSVPSRRRCYGRRSSRWRSKRGAPLRPAHRGMDRRGGRIRGAVLARLLRV